MVSAPICHLFSPPWLFNELESEELLMTSDKAWQALLELVEQTVLKNAGSHDNRNLSGGKMG
jgi:hypothetical protein